MLNIKTDCQNFGKLLNLLKNCKKKQSKTVNSCYKITKNKKPLKSSEKLTTITKKLLNIAKYEFTKYKQKNATNWDKQVILCEGAKGVKISLKVF